MVLISLVSVSNLLYFYISTFRSVCAVPNMAVFCSPWLHVSWYVADAFSEWLWNRPSRPYCYCYHLCFYIPHALYFYCKVFITIIIIIIIIAFMQGIYIYIYIYVHGDSGGEFTVRVLVIVKKSYEHLSNSEWLLTGRAMWTCKYKSVVNCNKEREINYCWFNFNFNLMFKWQISSAEMTDLLQFTTNVRKSHRQPQCTLQLVCEDGVLFVWGDLDVYLCQQQQHPKFGRAIRLLYPRFFCKLHSSSNPTNKNLTRFDLEIQTALSR